MSKEEEEFGVAWSNVDDNECDELFDDNVDEDGNTRIKHDEDTAHPSGPSSDDESVEEEANGAFPDSSLNNNNGSTTNGGGDSLHKALAHKPTPYAPSPQQIESSGNVEQLTSSSSRLASYSSGLKLRFSDTGEAPDHTRLFPDGQDEESALGNSHHLDDDDEDEDAFQESPWPGDDDDEEEDDVAALEEKESGDAFPPTDDDVEPPQHTNSKKKSEAPKKPLKKELSTNWMKFDDDKWDSSKHSSMSGQESSSSSNKKKKKEKSTTTTSSGGKKKKKSSNNGKKQSFSLEAGLAKVSKDTAAPEGPEQEGGEREQANEVISFWGEGSEEEEDEEANSNDPLAMALKARPPEQQERQSNRINDSSVFKSPKSAHSPRHSPVKDTQQQQQQGWLKKGLGTALDIVTAKLPFKPKEEEDKKVGEEENVVEVDDMPFPNQNATKQTAGKALMVDGSAMSESSAFVNRRINQVAGVFGQVVAGAFEKKAEASDELPADGSYDPSKVLVDKMNAQADATQENNRIKFAKETKKEQKVFHGAPIFDLFMDLPHPVADVSAFSTTFIGAPSDDDKDVKIQAEIQDRMRDITCLAFPDYDSSIEQEDDDGGPTRLRRNTKCSVDVTGFQYHSFVLELQSGELIYAHVRRYLPPHRDASFRYDVGRRLCRAMVICTRYPGGEDVFLAILKTVDAISSHHNAQSSVHIIRPQKWFLHNLHQKHQRLCGHYAQNFEERRGGPHILTLQGLEFADCMEYYSTVDATHFFVPNNLLHSPVISGFKVSYNSSMLPVIRCLGVANSLRLLSALLCERRIILVSVSPTRLDLSVKAALTILAQGMLNWPHQCIPVLPPALWSNLKSPKPYIVGVMAHLAYRLELTDRLGDVVVFNLDENTITAMGEQKLTKLVPDLCRSLSETMLQKRRIALPENVATEKDMTAMAILNSTSDFLAQDLVEILKADKQTMNGTAVAAKHMAKKATKAVKSTLKYFLGGTPDKDEDEEEPQAKKTKREKRMEPDAIYIEGCRNEAAEEATQLAFVSFFVRLLGNSAGYAIETEYSPYALDKEFFLQQRKDRGDGTNSPMWATLLNFCETQLLRDFVRLREEHIRQRQPIPIDAPLFWQCVDFLEVKNIDFGILNVRSVARMMLQKTSVQQMLPSNVRRLAMALTSKKQFEGNLEDAMIDLAELSRECSSSLNDVMSVIWLRTRDSKGLQWVHGYQAMRVLKEVLLNGPLAAVADATDGLQTIRTLAFRKSQGSEQIEKVAMEIYNLLADRSRLFLRRGVAAEQRRRYRDPDSLPLRRDKRLKLEGPFKDMHSAMNPALRPPEPQKRRASLSSRRASLSSRLPHRLSITKHIMALEPMGDSMTSFQNFLPNQQHRSAQYDAIDQRHNESISGSMTGDFASARRYVREIARKTADEEKERTKEAVRRRDSNAMGVELLKKQFMLLKVAIYISPVFFFFGNHEHFLTIVMFVWLSQQLQVFRAPIDSGAY